MLRRGDVRRDRLRLLKPAASKGGPFDPPLLSLSPRHLRRVDAEGGRYVTKLTGTREECWVRGDGARVRAAIDQEGKLQVLVERAGEEDVTKRLVWIPTREPESEGISRYYGRWEHGKDACVLSPEGAGVILHPESLTLKREPELVDVYEGDGVLLALRNIPYGARVVSAEGVEGLSVDDVVSDVRVPDIERGPDIQIHPREAFLRGFEPIGFHASFAGLGFAGFAPTQGDGAGDLARLVRKRDGVAQGGFRPINPPDNADEYLTLTLAKELAPSVTTGRVRLGKAGTIALSDGRKYRIRAGVRERLPKGTFELVACALLDSVLLIHICVPTEDLVAPDANTVLAHLKPFLLGIHVERADGPSDSDVNG